MTLERWGYKFDGPYLSPSTLDPKAGIYVIWCNHHDKWRVLDVGQSENVRERCQNHERTDCWEKNCHIENIRYSAHYMRDDSEKFRNQVERDIRSQANPRCG